jgi:competence protein ComEC
MSVPRSLGLLTRRPALPLILLFIAGILIHSTFPAEPKRLLIAIATTALAAAFTLHRRFINSALLGAAIVLCGVGVAQREQLQYPGNHIGLFAGDEPRLAQVELRLIDEPHFEYSLLENFRPLPPKQVVDADVLRVKTWNGWIPATGRTSLQIDQIQPRINIGQIVQVLGILERPPPAANPGQFDWAAYYRQQRILATLNALRSSNVQILSDPGPSPLDWLRTKARHLLAAGFTFDHALDHAMLRALLLGDRDPMLAGLKKEFQRTGIAFQLSVSGIHIAILAAVVLWLCRLVRLRPRYSLLITTAFVLLYAAVALPSYSGARWVILCAAAAVGMWTRRQTDHFQMLSLAVFVMLLWHPLDIYTAGFQLSVAVVFTLALLYPSLRAFALSQMDPHEIVAMSFVKPTRTRATWNRAKQWAFYLTAFAIINFFATLPLLAWHFGQLNLWTILCSVLLFPIALICLLGGVLKLFLTLLWPGMAVIWAWAAGWPIIVLRHAVDFLAKLPGGNVTLTAPPPWLIITYYILLFLPLAPPMHLFAYRRRWLRRGAPLVGVVLVIFFPFWSHPNQPSESPSLSVTLLSLGAGQCAVIEPPNGQTIFFDAGSTTITDLTEKIVSPFLQFQGRSKVDEIFLSHGDISIAGEIASAYHTSAVFISPYFRRNGIGNVPDEELLEKLDSLHLSPKEIKQGDHIDLGNNCAIDVLWPPPQGTLNSNNAGLVLRLTYAGKSILFPADIQDPAFTSILKHSQQLKSDVLIAPHHGSSEVLTPAFLKAVAPSMILSSNAARLTNKQKHFDLMASHTPLYRTSIDGAITVTVTGDGKINVAPFLKK